MKSGLPNAMKVGRELKDKGKSFGVRLDSGDLQYLSSQVRKRLDAEGLEDAFITVSNELDEQIVQQLVKDGAPVDAWGVGTKLVTGGEHSSLTGVYKLSAKSEAGRMQPVIKLSDNPQKTTDPGVKQVHRFHDENGTPLADMVCLDGESIELGETHVLYHPQLEAQFELSDYAEIVPLLQPVMIEGRRAEPAPSLSSIQEHVVDGLKRLHGTHKRLINPHRYKVSLSGALKELKVSLIRARQSRR
jgi:nicotinate phosphoribosyltransferase